MQHIRQRRRSDQSFRFWKRRPLRFGIRQQRPLCRARSTLSPTEILFAQGNHSRTKGSCKPRFGQPKLKRFLLGAADGLDPWSISAWNADRLYETSRPGNLKFLGWRRYQTSSGSGGFAGFSILINFTKVWENTSDWVSRWESDAPSNYEPNLSHKSSRTR